MSIGFRPAIKIIKEQEQRAKIAIGFIAPPVLTAPDPKPEKPEHTIDLIGWKEVEAKFYWEYR